MKYLKQYIIYLGRIRLFTIFIAFIIINAFVEVFKCKNILILLYEKVTSAILYIKKYLYINNWNINYYEAGF